MDHVGTVDASVTAGDVQQIVTEFRKAIGTGNDAPKKQSVDVLGWDFAFELNELARQNAELAGIELRLVRIPRAVLEKRAVEHGDIRFFELAALSVAVKKSGRKVKQVGSRCWDGDLEREAIGYLSVAGTSAPTPWLPASPMDSQGEDGAAALRRPMRQSAR